MRPRTCRSVRACGAAEVVAPPAKMLPNAASSLGVGPPPATASHLGPDLGLHRSYAVMRVHLLWGQAAAAAVTERRAPRQQRTFSTALRQPTRREPRGSSTNRGWAPTLNEYQNRNSRRSGKRVLGARAGVRVARLRFYASPRAYHRCNCSSYYPPL